MCFYRRQVSLNVLSLSSEPKTYKRVGNNHENGQFQLGNRGAKAKNVREQGKGQENLNKAGSKYG